MLTSNPKFDDIKIGDWFKYVYTGKILFISNKQEEYEKYRADTITFTDKDNTYYTISRYECFKQNFVDGSFIPYIATPQSLSSLAAAKVKQTLTKNKIADLEGTIDKLSYQMIT